MKKKIVEQAEGNHEELVTDNHEESQAEKSEISLTGFKRVRRLRLHLLVAQRCRFPRQRTRPWQTTTLLLNSFYFLSSLAKLKSILTANLENKGYEKLYEIRGPLIKYEKIIQSRQEKMQG